MAETNRFDPERPLGAGIGRLGREELIRLALALCSAAAESEGGAHGCIHPMNISLTPEGAALGPKASHAPGDYSTDELEYMAPELFWDRELSSAADVYSIGLVLYAGVTGGRLPFFPCGPESITNEQRAAALRRRLNGEAVAVPPVAGEKLGAVLRKALAFDRAERYANTAELAADLKDCVGEGDAAAMAAFGKPESELSEVERTMAGIIASFDDGEAAGKPEKPSGKQEKAPQPEKKPEVEYKVDKGFEQKPQKKSPPEKQPPKRGSRRGLYVVLAICVVVVIAALVVNAVWGLPGGGEDEAVSPSPSASAEPSPTPTPAPPPPPTPPPPPPPGSHEHDVIADLKWAEARDLCVERGGHLVTISDADELATVTDLAETYGVSLVWIGFYRGEDGAIHWVDGEEIDYYIWGDGEPSGHDTDGTAEDYGLLWQTDSGWIYNDSRNDPISAYPGIYSGNIAYICEYDG